MSKSPPNEREIHISSDEMRRQRVFENVGMALLWWQSSSLGARSEDAEELRSVKLPALLTPKRIIGTVRPALAQSGL